ncbi:ABC transporter ATP-binding protein [Anaerocolumna sp. AGMB13020]|uniref:ABC transporter ATP-binding protein n=1 Tax=Anaerocolumna sp. AGMB13020 TaxID=3081750 RepID=UPI002954B15E|nr:ABC transporter ATP-binding protein [Anaerocolumna sp. AGMB13020]WOO34865.1 ABC transporter ATP-binding protein [Anaerocolumna sp. AGMB13020]
MKQLLKNLVFLEKLSKKICPYYYYSKTLDEIIQIATTSIYIFMPKRIIDSMLRGDAWNTVLREILFFITAISITKIIDLATRTYRNVNTNRADVDTVKHYSGICSELDYEKFESAEVRDLIEVIMYRVRGTVVVDFYVKITSTFIQVILFSALLYTLNPLFLLVLFIIALIRIFIKSKINNIESDTIPDFKKNGRHFRYIDNSLVNFLFAKEIRINNVDKLFEKKYEDNIRERYDLNTTYNKRIFKANSMKLSADALEMLALYGYAGYKSFIEEITLGSFTMYITTVNYFTNAISNLINLLLDLIHTLDYVKKYNELTEMIHHETREKIDITKFPSEPYLFEFSNVSFKYPHTEKLVLKNINLIIKPGEKLSIVGENGTGKTTFIKLICRIYVPTSGKILLNGIDIQTLEQKDYACIIAAVFQDFKLFSFDIEDNILLNMPKDAAKLQSVIKKADLEDKINKLSDGVYTYIDKEFVEDGVEFSGGERQKLALARAYYKDSPMVIMDEPTASMDPVAELNLYKRFNDIIGKKTVIFISHRLASTKFCDKVVVLANGMIIEQGTHDELMRQQGNYYEMFHMQSKLYTGDKTIGFEAEMAELE